MTLLWRNHVQSPNVWERYRLEVDKPRYRFEGLEGYSEVEGIGWIVEGQVLHYGSCQGIPVGLDP